MSTEEQITARAYEIVTAAVNSRPAVAAPGWSTALEQARTELAADDAQADEAGRSAGSRPPNIVDLPVS